MRHRGNLLTQVILAGLLWATATALSRAQGWPEVVNFWSQNSTLNGQPMPVGAVIVAYDPTGTECGTSIVTVPGWYGLLACERDQGDTPQDEGADPGDVISFTINGLPATPVPIRFNWTPVPPSTTITWTSNGDLWEVNLSAFTLFGDLDCDCEVGEADIRMAASRWRCRRGEECYADGRCDLDDDGSIDIVDLMLVAAHWGETCRYQ